MQVVNLHIFYSNSCKVIYGFKIRPKDDPYVKIAEDGTEFIQGAVPGSFLVDVFPFRGLIAIMLSLTSSRFL